MRVLPLIEGSDCDYSRLQAMAWAAGGASTLRWLTDLVAKQILAAVRRHAKKPLVIDCKGIQGVADHAFDLVREEIRASSRSILFVGADSLRIPLERGLGRAVATYQGELDVVIYGSENVLTRSEAFSTVETAIALHQQYLQDVIERSYRKFERPKRLLSTPLIADGVFDAQKIISKPEMFIWCSVALADRVERTITDWFAGVERSNTPADYKWLKDLRILAVSLRSSPFAAAVGLLLGDGLERSIEIVDHVGPKHRILEEHAIGAVLSKGQYILISDFVIGGTELKIARAYAEMRGGSIRFVTALASYLEPDAYGVPMMPLVNLRALPTPVSYQF